ncbi:NAD(P)H-dependent oxidoreductase [Marinobacter halodurans]|uniref:NAD(P)H-dependent oxidoreductase n=1 Tax=Marinobacter halodurans TaxID=2528979 RepID=A0ABY1ZGS8_9GAMM|nr:NAD(P)H-dependent oxidoreductase [Marinobacter halodurans]TBW49095.1 NAD(P)H-dependent oxidoreductase [Marinobacter halodurans]
MSMLNEALNWRYAAKRMNGQMVPAEKLERILDAIHLAPSSFGLQPYTVLVIDDPALKATIRERAGDQPQITECSHLLVFAAWDPVEETHVDELIHRIASERDMDPTDLAGYRDMIKGTLRQRTPDQNVEWAARQAYIGLGTVLSAAALELVDASPMEGFDPVALDAVLGLRDRGLHGVVLVALGYRDTSTDWLAGMKKVRWPRERTIQPVG